MIFQFVVLLPKCDMQNRT